MTDPRDRDTVPAPADLEAKLGQQLAQLELACANIGDLLGKINFTINAIKMSALTTEHRTHVIHEAKRNDRRWLVDLERRVRVLESPPPTEDAAPAAE